MTTRTQGTVKLWADEKGWGFIHVAGGKDVFVHIQAVNMAGLDTLYAGDDVAFEVELARDGASSGDEVEARVAGPRGERSVVMTGQGTVESSDDVRGFGLH